MRFPSFKSKWEKNYFKDELDLLKNNTLSRAELNYKSGKIKNIHYGDILVKFENSIYSNSKEIPYINEEYIPKNYKSMLLKSGDLIIADTAEDYTVGKSVEIINNDENMVISGLHTIPCRAKQNNFSLGYLGYYTNSPSFHNQLLPLIQGIKVSSISKSQIKETYISYPEKDEQEKIVNFLALVNSRIHTQSKIIEDLETLKNKINDTLIYQQGYDRTIPLYELSTLKNGYAFKSSSYTENADFKIITIGNVSGAKFFDTKECNKIQYVPKDIQPHQKLKKNDILISLTGNVGRVSLCNEDNCLLNQRVGVLELNSDANREFIYQCLSNKKFEQAMICKGQGAAQLNIGKSDIESFEIPLFDNKYQEYISSVLSFYDTKIQKEKDMLELYKKQKAYLLQNMFI